MKKNDVEIVSFGNENASDRKMMREFVRFHWNHYDCLRSPYIPLLDYEYLGSRLLGMKGLLEDRNLFYQYGRARFFLAKRAGKIVGRVNAFVNERFCQYWKRKVGHFGNFECIDDTLVASRMLEACAEWLREQGQEYIQGPQNFPINDATPGVLVEGYNTRPVIYYHYNHPYYKNLLEATGVQPVKNYLSWEISVQNNSICTNLENTAQKVIERFNVTIEHWGVKRVFFCQVGR